MKIVTLNLESGFGITKGYYQYLTYIAQFLFPVTGKYVELAAAFLNSENPEIILLNEVDKGSKRSGGLDQFEAIKTKIGGNGVFFPAMKKEGIFDMGNAIITTYEILSSTNHILPGSGETRVLGEARLKIKEREITIFVAHLGLRKANRTLQLNAIKSMVATKKGPVILGGDLNAYDSEELKVLEKAGLTKHATHPSFPSWNPKKSFDHIFLNDDFILEKSYAYDKEKFSDHLPLVAEVEIK